jgi:hypothetical protein
MKPPRYHETDCCNSCKFTYTFGDGEYPDDWYCNKYGEWTRPEMTCDTFKRR